MNRYVSMAAALLLGIATVDAAEIEGVRFADTVELGGETLAFNGAGLRSKFFIDVYVGGLYLPRATTNAASALSQAGPKRVRLHILYSEIGREKLVGAWNDGFEANLSDAERRTLADEIERFNGLFEGVVAGNDIRLDYLPGEGTAVFINGAKRGVVPGEAFHRAWLRIFIGESPADDDLKRGMLGG